MDGATRAFASGTRPARKQVAAEATMKSQAEKSLAGQLLVAMPQMMDPRFARSVVYVCAHSENEGAMGLVINKLLASLTMEELLTHLKLEAGRLNRPRPGAVLSCTRRTTARTRPY
jgi:putative AlgH/UPF0301 family transcriptional regulator